MKPEAWMENYLNMQEQVLLYALTTPSHALPEILQGSLPAARIQSYSRNPISTLTGQTPMQSVRDNGSNCDQAQFSDGYIDHGAIRAKSSLDQQLSEGHIEKIKAEVAKDSKHDEFDHRSSIFHHILRSDLPEPEKDPARLKREAFALLAAGTITTAGTLTLITYFILENAEIETRLRKDLKEVTACYPKEMPRRNPRISPDHELQYKQWSIPKNTPVGMSICHLHMDPEVYPEPYKFIPDRWIGDVDPRVHRNLVPFVKGSRNCLGLNLAWAEMYLVLGILFRPGAHKMSLDCDESDIVPIHDSDVGIPKSDSRGLRVRFE
ncbi:MAG: hypothetical protein LQ350_007680 [Teloschistes chrysophthalmus]|nr:MAG: hypothetical protein LQ350_007680 [Niorma chrysophthalma]